MISDEAGTNTIFDVEAGNINLGSFGRRLLWKWTVKKGAPRLTAEKHME